jgi:hypothetical protein
VDSVGIGQSLRLDFDLVLIGLALDINFVQQDWPRERADESAGVWPKRA